jgi:hypothetical protein
MREIYTSPLFDQELGRMVELSHRVDTKSLDSLPTMDPFTGELPLSPEDAIKIGFKEFYKNLGIPESLYKQHVILSIRSLGTKLKIREENLWFYTLQYASVLPDMISLAPQIVILSSGEVLEGVKK